MWRMVRDPNNKNKRFVVEFSIELNYSVFVVLRWCLQGDPLGFHSKCKFYMAFYRILVALAYLIQLLRISSVAI